MIHLAGKDITTDSDKISRFQKPEIQKSRHSRVSATKDGLGTKNLVLTQFRAKKACFERTVAIPIYNCSVCSTAEKLS